MTQRAHAYDHRVHAGNAGDVWKHFVLAEVASCQLIQNRGLIYAESHVGQPEYCLDNLVDSQSEWTKGIGRCWKHLPALQNFCYFRVLANLNPQGLGCYPGSARLVLETARMHGSKLHAEVWDVDFEVAASWTSRQDQSTIKFHQGDGFSGIRSLLDRSPPGLLLIDPPYLDTADFGLSEDLVLRAEKKGWAVLWWYMLEMKTLPDIPRFEVYSLKFSRVGMDGGQWTGAAMAMAGADAGLRERLRKSCDEFVRILQV